MRRTIATAFAAMMLVAGAAPALAAAEKKVPAPQSVAPATKAGGHSGGGCYEEYPASTKPNA